MKRLLALFIALSFGAAQAQTLVQPRNGGTGLATTTPYSPIFSGTTATGAFNASRGPGTSGQCLISGGAGVVPNWGTCGGGLTVGTTTIASGTTTRILYDNAGVLGEYAVTGTGTTVPLSTSPTFTTSIITPLVSPGATGGTIALSTTAGQGPTIAMGTATTAVGVAVTQTRNAAVVFDSFKLTYMDTAVSDLSSYFKILGGTNGTTPIANFQISNSSPTLVVGTAGTAGQIFSFDFGRDGGVLTRYATADISTYHGGFVHSIYPASIRYGTSMLVGWSGTTSQTALTTNFNQASAGVLNLGTTAANALGSLNLLNTTASGNIMVGSATALTLTAGAIGMQKITASGTAPGAAGAKLEVVCGTNAGSAKLIMVAGTSATAVTVIDNVGAAVTGC